MVWAAPHFDHIAGELHDRLEGRVFVAHNAAFDWRFVSTELSEAMGQVPDVARLCTVRLTRTLVPRLRRRNLDAVSAHFEVVIHQRHRAYGDALATRAGAPPPAGRCHSTRGGRSGGPVVVGSASAPAQPPGRSRHGGSWADVPPGGGVLSAPVASIAELPLVRSTKVGRIRIHALEAGLQRLDGGAMFGIVPKPLWEKRIGADERNRITLALRCLLVETPGALVLVDSGIGNKEDEKFREIYGVENEGHPTRVEDALRAAGFAPEDVDVVLSTHLHFDHAGGNTMRDDNGTIVPTFPRARYLVQRGELEFARRKNERIRASYPMHNIEPVVSAGLQDLVEGETEVTEGLRVLPTPRPHAPAPVRAGAERRGDGVLPRRRLSHLRTPAAAVDHGLRRRAAGDARVQAFPVGARPRRELAAGVRARSGRAVGSARPERGEADPASGRAGDRRGALTR